MALAGLLLAAAAQAQDDTAAAAAADPAGTSRPHHQVPRASSPITVDAHLDEPAWAGAAVIPLAYETRPGDNIPAPVATECRITYDDDHLYVAFRASDPEPEKIRARLADRDSAFSDDFVGVVLDTFNDERRAFELFVNPLGVQMDLTMDDVSDREDSSWDAIWSSAGRLTESGFEVEIAVPFSSLRFPRTQGPQTWGIDALRIYPRSSSHRLANNPQDRDVDCYVCQFAKLVGFDGITPGRNLEINPTLTGNLTEQRDDFPDGSFETGDETSEAGLTVSWGVTPNLNLSGTVNPDFSQVEADVAQLDVNTRFALFFPERRPFFLEDADLFNTPLDAVFTRTVADPAWGGKLTGKEGKHAIGVFFAEDELTNLIFPGDQGSDSGSFDFETTDAVLRYRRDLGKSSALGALITSRTGDDYSSLVGGLDGLLRFGESDSLTFQLLQSQTEYPLEIAQDFEQPEGRFDDHALRFTYVHQDRRWRWWTVYEDLGEGFRADMGFLPRVGIRHARSGTQRTWWGEDNWYDRLQAGVNFDRVEDRSGQRLEQSWSTWASFQGPRQSFLELNLEARDRFFNGVEFDEQEVSTYFEIQPTGKFFFGLFAKFGDEIDFTNTQPGELMLLEPSIRWDLGKHLRTRLSHQVRRLDVAGGTLFEANLTQGRLLYQLNLRTFVRAIFQFTDVTRDPALHPPEDEVDAESRDLFTQLLFSYKVNPRTVLFLGYSDNYRGDQDITLTQENRAIFLKIGYAWVL